ncbi:hypothetical protein [Frigoriglobus tundricola]|uniref:hypothetical protein n=1 Tax=Frigoriglobus tundricola TaxID=2774151 RepID=UPI00148ECFEB|nr:hypothetical protein [Frigoriglobus tundricola]
MAVLLTATALFAALQIGHNWHLFSQPIHEDGDPATVSLLVLKAKRFELFHGHCSRLGFYHPGPGLVYTLAGAEALFYDWWGIVPAPHNAHMLGQLLLSAALIGVALTVVIQNTRGPLVGAAAGLVFLIYFAREGHLASHWFAYVFFMVYLAFQVSAASVANGRAGHLGWLALTGGLAVHSHVSFVAFVVPISAYAVVRLWAKGGYRVRDLSAEERSAWALFAVVVGVFVLPIALHTALHYPGEIGRYLHYSRRPATGGVPAGAVGTFLVRTLTNDAVLGWRLALGVFAGALAAVVSFRGSQRSFARQLGAVALLSSAAMAYYAARGVDDLEQTYIGIFFGSVLLLGLALIGMRVAAVFDRGAVWRGTALVIGAGLAAWATLTGTFKNHYAGAPALPAIAEAIGADPRWEGGPPAVTTDTRCWGQVAGLLLELERRGKHAWVVDRVWDVVLTDQFRLAGRPVSVLWQIDATPQAETPTGVRRDLEVSRDVAFRELNTRAALGAPLALGSWGRPPGAKPEAGWAAIGGLTYLLAASKNASVLLDLEPGHPSEVRLTIRARGVAPTKTGDGQRVGVVVNGRPVGEVVFPFGRMDERELVFSGDVLGSGEPVRLEFLFPDAGGYRSRRGPGPAELYSIELHGLTLAPKP